MSTPKGTLSVIPKSGNNSSAHQLMDKQEMTDPYKRIQIIQPLKAVRYRFMGQHGRTLKKGPKWYNFTFMKCPIGRSRDRKQTVVGKTTYTYGVSLWSDENALKLARWWLHNSVKTLYYKHNQTAHFRRMSFMVCELYLNKGFFLTYTYIFKCRWHFYLPEIKSGLKI